VTGPQIRPTKSSPRTSETNAWVVRPHSATIAHGYYTLSLAPVLLAQVLPLDGFAMAVNYGLERLRFPASLPVGDRVRMQVGLDSV
jgi:acyl dehydratase